MATQKRKATTSADSTEGDSSISIDGSDSYSEEELAFDSCSVGSLIEAMVKLFQDHPEIIAEAIRESNHIGNLTERVQQLERVLLSQVVPRKITERPPPCLTRTGRAGRSFRP